MKKLIIILAVHGGQFPLLSLECRIAMLLAFALTCLSGGRKDLLSP